jgi:hypothetical protein
MVPDDDLPPKLAQLWWSVYDPVILEALIIERNRKHFAQANDTPFTRDILGLIPFSGTGPIADSILARTFTVDDPIVQLVLENYQVPPVRPSCLRIYNHHNHHVDMLHLRNTYYILT